MKPETESELEAELEDDLRSEYDFSQMSGGVRGKYAERYQSGTNLVLGLGEKFSMDKIRVEDVKITIHHEFLPSDKIKAENIFVRTGNNYVRQILPNTNYESFPKEFFVIDVPILRKGRSKIYGKSYRKKEVDLDTEVIDHESPNHDTISGRREFFLNLRSINFHYSDVDHIEQRYNNIFTEPIIETIILQAKTGNTENLSLRISNDFFGGLDINEQDIFEWILEKKYRIPGLGPEEQFRLYQIAMVKSDALELGLEIVDPDQLDFGELNSFNQKIEQVSTLGVDVGSNVSEIRKKYERKSYERIIKNLSTLNDKDVLIKGDFRIYDYKNYLESQGINIEANAEMLENYMLVYSHPLSKPYSENIRISVRLPKSKINFDRVLDYEEFARDESLVPLKVLGSVARNINPKQNQWDLRITPFVIYG